MLLWTLGILLFGCFCNPVTVIAMNLNNPLMTNLWEGVYFSGIYMPFFTFMIMMENVFGLCRLQIFLPTIRIGTGLVICMKRLLEACEEHLVACVGGAYCFRLIIKWLLYKTVSVLKWPFLLLKSLRKKHHI